MLRSNQTSSKFRDSRFSRRRRRASLPVVNDIAALARRIDRDRLERAKAMPFAEKFFAGAELFEDACEITRAGIRHQNPGWNEDEVEGELIRRLKIREKIEARLSR
ncbi:MAG: hypothetical protein JWO82_3891 [Akkermansiaceae bacterium]|nr:hypothetical protein [Akkermansiaceae bacterium]